MIEKAREQVAEIEAQAKERGQQAALREAEQHANAKVDRQMQSFLPALAKTVESIQHSRHTWIQHWEQRTLGLAAAIARRVIRGELTRQPEIPVTWMREALEMATGQGRITLHLNPHDFETLGARAQVFMSQLATLGTSQVVADSEVEMGGCRVVTEFGCVDQQISSQLERIEQELIG
jgi:flagellar assembly protein FliH